MSIKETEIRITKGNIQQNLMFNILQQMYAVFVINQENSEDYLNHNIGIWEEALKGKGKIFQVSPEVEKIFDELVHEIGEEFKNIIRGYWKG